MFGSTNIIKDSDKGKYEYSGYGKGEYGKGEYNLMTRLGIFGVDNSSSSHTEIARIIFLALGEGDTFNINENLGAPEKNINKELILVKK